MNSQQNYQQQISNAALFSSSQINVLLKQQQNSQKVLGPKIDDAIIMQNKKSQMPPKYTKQDFEKYFEEQFQIAEPYKISCTLEDIKKIQDLPNLINQKNQLFKTIFTDKAANKKLLDEYDIVSQQIAQINQNLLNAVHNQKQYDIENQIQIAMNNSDDVANNLYKMSFNNILHRFKNAYVDDSQNRTIDELKNLLRQYASNSDTVAELITDQYCTIKTLMHKIEKDSKEAHKTALHSLAEQILYQVYNFLYHDPIDNSTYKFLNRGLPSIQNEKNEQLKIENEYYFKIIGSVSTMITIYDFHKKNPQNPLEIFDQFYNSYQNLLFNKIFLSIITKTPIECITDNLHEGKNEEHNIYQKLSQQLDAVQYPECRFPEIDNIIKKLFHDETNNPENLKKITHFDIWFIWNKVSHELSLQDIKLPEEVSDKMQFLFEQQKAIDSSQDSFCFLPQKENIQKAYNKTKNLYIKIQQNCVAILAIKDLLIFYFNDIYNTIKSRWKGPSYDIIVFLFLNIAVQKAEIRRMATEDNPETDRHMGYIMKYLQDIFDQIITQINQLQHNKEKSKTLDILSKNMTFRDIPWSKEHEEVIDSYPSLSQKDVKHTPMKDLIFKIRSVDFYCNAEWKIYFLSQIEHYSQLVLMLLLTEQDTSRCGERTIDNFTEAAMQFSQSYFDKYQQLIECYKYLKIQQSNPFNFKFNSQSEISLTEKYNITSKALVAITNLKANDTIMSLQDAGFSQEEINTFISFFTNNLNFINFPSDWVDPQMEILEFKKTVALLNMQCFQQSTVLKNFAKSQKWLMKWVQFPEYETESKITTVQNYDIYTDTLQKQINKNLSLYSFCDKNFDIIDQNNEEFMKDYIANNKISLKKFLQNQQSIDIFKFYKSPRSKMQKLHIANITLGNLLLFPADIIYGILNICKKNKKDFSFVSFQEHLIKHRDVMPMRARYNSLWISTLHQYTQEYDKFKKLPILMYIDLQRKINKLSSLFENITDIIYKQISNQQRYLQNIQNDFAILKMQAKEMIELENKHGVNKKNDILLDSAHLLKNIDKFSEHHHKYNESLKFGQNNAELQMLNSDIDHMQSLKTSICEALKYKLSHLEKLYHKNPLIKQCYDELSTRYCKILNNTSKIFDAISSHDNKILSQKYKNNLQTQTQLLQNILRDLNGRQGIFLMSIMQNQGNVLYEDKKRNYELQNFHCQNVIDAEICSEKIQYNLKQIEQHYEQKRDWMFYNIANLLMLVSISCFLYGIFNFSSASYFSNEENIANQNEDESLSAFFINVSFALVGFKILMSIYINYWLGIDGLDKNVVFYIDEILQILTSNNCSHKMDKNINEATLYLLNQQPILNEQQDPSQQHATKSIVEAYKDAFTIFSDFVYISLPFTNIETIKQYLLDENAKMEESQNKDKNGDNDKWQIKQEDQFFNTMQQFERKMQIKLHDSNASCQRPTINQLAMVKYYNNILFLLQCYFYYYNITEYSQQTTQLLSDVFNPQNSYHNKLNHTYNEIDLQTQAEIRNNVQEINQKLRNSLMASGMDLRESEKIMNSKKYRLLQEQLHQQYTESEIYDSSISSRRLIPQRNINESKFKI